MYLHLTESSARPGMQVTAEAEHEGVVSENGK